jgi:SAM-dependent methyltransferase
MSRRAVLEYYQQEIKVEDYRKDRFLTLGGILVNGIEKAVVLSFSEGAKNQGRVLDAGTGTGRVALWFEGERVGIDSSVPMLKKATETGLDVVCADFSALPFKSNSFSTVIALRVFIRVKSPLTVFREVARVLRSGGHFIFDTSNKCSVGYITNWLSQEPPHNLFLRGDIKKLLQLVAFNVVETAAFFLIPRGVYQKINRVAILKLWRIERLLLKAKLGQLACTIFWCTNIMKYDMKTEAA